MNEPAAAPTGLGPKGVVTAIEPDRYERTVVRRSAQTRATVPSVEFAAEVRMERTLATEAELGCGVTALVVRAAAHALRLVPRVNGAYRDGHYELYSRVNIGVTIAEAGLYVTPTVFDADEKSAIEIAAEIAEQRTRALDGELVPADLTGATFSLIDSGKYDIVTVTPLIISPQAAALAAGPVRETPVVRNGAIVAGQTMVAMLAADQRIVYGDHASSFLAEFKAHLEEGIA
jgi:pyruvate dehydrogenase E2 component (dihydrolipoamide acetyltransferase)